MRRRKIVEDQKTFATNIRSMYSDEQWTKYEIYKTQTHNKHIKIILLQVKQSKLQEVYLLDGQSEITRFS